MMNDLMTIIRQRYSEREPFDSNRQVPTADVEKILEGARWAPTSHNMQNFEIVVVDDERLLNRLGNLNTIPSPEFIRENFEQLSMTEKELAQKKVGILGTQFPPAWQDKAQLESAIKERMPLNLGRLINGAPTILILLYDTRKRAPASPGDLLGAVSLGAVMENMWLVAQSLDIGFQILSMFGSPVQKEVKKIMGIPDHMAVLFAIRLGYPFTRSEALRVRRETDSFAHRNEYGTMDK
ncbi:nitroreductase [Methanocorpusculum labreanum Z]|uniref:Nitroreductase n=1 Tax=Methanocorpusculum labreanum (strain ATCC 43576 / DSM 4855 / Z) TaxID=410358 RepID=A2SQA3_METLZ|nr:nitroreductase family protein [Methanocorpusculum labreanum]ABN06509.1 nitroreductase [Methanocorpusculum labreanum Z]MDY3201875.1 nitroreductase family protein [Methanocorpusculum sp.]